MYLYLPIAEISINVLLIFSIGAIVGILSGMFGVGGGFLVTPLLFFVGIPPAVAVASSANQIVASSVSALFAHVKRRTVDFKMGTVLLIGGMFGVAIGVAIFTWLKTLGQVELFINLSYVIFLGVIGGLMFVESARAMLRARRGVEPKPRSRAKWMDPLPFKMRFPTSRLYISVIPPLLIGAGVGILSAIMGVGGGFIMVPAMIYLLNIPTKVVIGTSIFQIIFVTGFTTILHSATSQSVDIVLAVILLLGGVIGAQVGAVIGAKLRAEQLRILLAALVLLVCFKLAFDLVVTPSNLFIIEGGV